MAQIEFYDRGISEHRTCRLEIESIALWLHLFASMMRKERSRSRHVPAPFIPTRLDHH